MSQLIPSDSPNAHLPVAILGGGPVGLAAAAHLLEQGLRPIIFEMGESVGHNISQWDHVRLFSPWSQNMDAAAVRLLESEGWTGPDPEHVPFGHELRSQYLEPLAAVPSISRSLKLSSKVVSVTRQNVDKVKTSGRNELPFVIRFETANGNQDELEARAVIDATGSWNTPNPLGTSGVEALGERAASDQVFYGIPDVIGRDRARFQSKKILIIGSGHSAANVLLDLALLQTQFPDTELHWGIRAATPEKYFGGEDSDALAGRGALGRRLHELVDSGKLVIHTSFRTRSIKEQFTNWLLKVFHPSPRLSRGLKSMKSLPARAHARTSRS
ncbi:NAD(P)-binding domain-containing protein [bacterium]|nr:NAD(P)-binding domain-containing protein [bacterium]